MPKLCIDGSIISTALKASCSVWNTVLRCTHPVELRKLFDEGRSCSTEREGFILVRRTILEDLKLLYLARVGRRVLVLV